jgi:hypothetical protein
MKFAAAAVLLGFFRHGHAEPVTAWREAVLSQEPFPWKSKRAFRIFLQVGNWLLLNVPKCISGRMSSSRVLIARSSESIRGRKFTLRRQSMLRPTIVPYFRITPMDTWSAGVLQRYENQLHLVSGLPSPTQETEIFELDESCISNSKLEISEWTAQTLQAGESDLRFRVFELEMQDSSNFKSPSVGDCRDWGRAPSIVLRFREFSTA